MIFEEFPLYFYRSTQKLWGRALLDPETFFWANCIKDNQAEFQALSKWSKYLNKKSELVSHLNNYNSEIHVFDA